MDDSRKKPGWAAWAAVAVVMLAYPASRGPYCYLEGRYVGYPIIKKTRWLYKPVIFAEESLMPESVHESYLRYMGWCYKQGMDVGVREAEQKLGRYPLGTGR